MIPLRVLGDRVLVKPDILENAPKETESGVILATTLAAAVTGSDPTQSLSRGTVVAVGKPRHPLHDEADTLADKLVIRAVNGNKSLLQDAAAMLLDLTRREPCCSVGDDVLFSHDAGQQITIESEPWIILKEDELLAVIEPER